MQLTIKYIKKTVGKRNFYKSKDVYLFYEGGEIQFRGFGGNLLKPMDFLQMLIPEDLENETSLDGGGCPRRLPS